MKKYLPIFITLGAAFIILLILTYWQPAKKDVLDQTIWLVEEFNSDSIIQFTTLTIRFHNQKINGSSECNRFNGRYEITGDMISIDLTERTTEGCMEPDIMAQDDALINALGQVTAFKLSGNDLVLYDPDGELFLDLVLMAD